MPIIQDIGLYFNIFPGGRHEPGAIRGSVKIHNEVMKMMMRLFSG